jgi:hypothetical protein
MYVYKLQHNYTYFKNITTIYYTYRCVLEVIIAVQQNVNVIYERDLDGQKDIIGTKETVLAI